MNPPKRAAVTQPNHARHSAVESVQCQSLASRNHLPSSTDIYSIALQEVKVSPRLRHRCRHGHCVVMNFMSCLVGRLASYFFQLSSASSWPGGGSVRELDVPSFRIFRLPFFVHCAR